MSNRGHDIHLYPFHGIQMGRNLGFTTDAIDPRIEGLAHDDWKASNPRAALRRAVDMFCRRAAYEVSDITDAVTATRPDALLVDINTWGAMSAADAGDIPWACFSPYTPPLQSHGLPPFGLGLAPLPGMLGRIRDAALRPIMMGMIERTVLPPGNRIRASAEAPPVASADEFMRRPADAGGERETVGVPPDGMGRCHQMIAPLHEPAMYAVPDWLEAIDRPIVLVTTSSQEQADSKLVVAAMAALADEPVHVVATLPAGLPRNVIPTPNATVLEFVPHGPVLDRAVCAVTHGGMGATQKALARGVPVCVVPFGRDQFSGTPC
jgi:UDP:flavonoid glycosyltransferase YjiC (YdhE family)